MADNYIDRLTAMQGKYRLGVSTYSYIGQVKISYILKGRDFETEFHALVSDVTKVFAVELPEVILLPFLDDKVDCIAFINCRTITITYGLLVFSMTVCSEASVWQPSRTDSQIYGLIRPENQNTAHKVQS